MIYDMTTIYNRLNEVGYDRTALLSLPTAEVTEEVYEHFLGILPPIWLPRGWFAVPERMVDNIVSAFGRDGDRYYHAFLDLDGSGR